MSVICCTCQLEFACQCRRSRRPADGRWMSFEPTRRQWSNISPTFSGIASPAFCGWNTGHAPNLEDLIHNVVLPLTCYCAQTIRKHKIPFKKRIPPVVESFVERHGELP